MCAWGEWRSGSQEGLQGVMAVACRAALEQEPRREDTSPSTSSASVTISGDARKFPGSEGAQDVCEEGEGPGVRPCLAKVH